MLLIDCPWCGPRDEKEFLWGGENPSAANRQVHIAADDALADELYYRRNICGPTTERWVHWAGCRQWLAVVRDTATHKIMDVAPLGAPAPPADRAGS
jgi:heterotetrameric sarcosine oxidase delta subunit